MAKSATKQKGGTPSKSGSQHTPRRTPQQARARRMTAAGETPRMAPYRTPQSGHKYSGQSSKRVFAEARKERALRAYRKMMRREERQAAAKQSSTAVDDQPRKEADQNCSSGSGSESEQDMDMSLLPAYPNGTGPNWKGTIEPLLMSIEPTPVQSHQRPKRKPTDVAADSVDLLSPATPEPSSAAKALRRLSVSSSRKKDEFRQRTKRTGTGQPLMGDRMQSVLSKLKFS